ncbi:gram positive anchor domain protein [Renibacterium salmoninarum ATCC 33209]|uniref:Gram positive anchor domain protein n=1 Tax=Renibacterium salmoninarum (strain ATCC 33209 / DSM 20767 / JCM 11484 / NBRC 15589 / NCIMB 2235) TaxID=288705 RepID=A9WNZ5_RENSM|nr:LPXTG cell wall anchor domain-containing protein [Renibacterium salmoninarum]ABY23287.1 gram positive anchor domain protein [Renibacterium salmoninarum ATCC 33209]
MSVENPPAGLNFKEAAGKITVVANQTAGANNFGYTKTAPNGDLPDTGVNGTIGLIAAGGGLLIIGGLLLMVFRRPCRS